jgi:two-component system NtrC family sensor kinase
MIDTLQILIVTTPETAEVINTAPLVEAGYYVTSLSQPGAVETWLNTFSVDALLILVHHSVIEGLSYSTEILKTHPYLPVILVTPEVHPLFLDQALQMGLVDYLTIPLEASALLRAVQRSLVHRKHIHAWERSAHVLAGLEDGVILVDLDGLLLMVNRAAQNIFPYGDGKPEGRMASELFNQPDLLEVLKPGNTFPYRREISLDDGRVFSAQASIIPELGIAVVMQDITYLKELDRIKTDFVNTITHDLRSPLTAIYGFVGLIDRVGPINEQQAEFIHHIQSSVHHITSLINDLMDLGQLEAGYDIQMEDVNLKDIVCQSIEFLDYQMNSKMQELVQTIPEQVPVILGNPLHLQRMVTNLLDNAIKFTPPFGKIRVQCRTEANQLILEVADNGPGIPLDDQPHVFEKFYRADNLSRDTLGTGLGLSIVKSIIDKHHGRIWLESSPLGTTFSVILPVK